MKAVIIALLMLLTVLADMLSALDCIQVPIPRAAAESEIVLFGRVESARNVIDADPIVPYYYVASVRVFALWKGSTPSVIELAQSPVVGGMDLPNHVGTNYLFFLRRLSAGAPLGPHWSVTSGYTAHECISKQTPNSDYVGRELGKSYPTEAK